MRNETPGAPVLHSRRISNTGVEAVDNCMFFILRFNVLYYVVMVGTIIQERPHMGGCEAVERDALISQETTFAGLCCATGTRSSNKPPTRVLLPRSWLTRGAKLSDS